MVGSSDDVVDLVAVVVIAVHIVSAYILFVVIPGRKPVKADHCRVLTVDQSFNLFIQYLRDHSVLLIWTEEEEEVSYLYKYLYRLDGKGRKTQAYIPQ